jgi:thiol-disulfide isomerase/thioredoxin
MMRLLRPLLLIPVSLSLLLSSFAAPVQKQGRPAKTTPTATPVVSEINTESLLALLKRESDKPLLVNFWATWCDPCRDEFPDLVKIDQEFRSRGLDFVTVSLDDMADIKTEVPKFLQRMNATMPAYLLNVPDPDPAITAVDPKWQGDLPATILYTPKGEIAFKHFGRVDAGELRQAIEKLLGTGKGAVI